MKLTITKKVSDNTSFQLEAEGNKVHEVLSDMALFMEKDICGKCRNEGIRYEGGRAKKDNLPYVRRRCLKCKASSFLGAKNDGSYWWHEWEVYVRPEANNSPASTEQSRPAQQMQQGMNKQGLNQAPFPQEPPPLIR